MILLEELFTPGLTPVTSIGHGDAELSAPLRNGDVRDSHLSCKLGPGPVPHQARQLTVSGPLDLGWTLPRSRHPTRLSLSGPARPCSCHQQHASGSATTPPCTSDTAEQSALVLLCRGLSWHFLSDVIWGMAKWLNAAVFETVICLRFESGCPNHQLDLSSSSSSPLLR